MASSMSFTFSRSQLKRIRKLAAKSPLLAGKGLKIGFAKYGLRFQRKYVDERLSGRVGGRGLKRRTARLANSAKPVQFGIAEKIDTLGVRFTLGGGNVGGGVDYARIHEFGGTIRPKRGEFLVIPFFPSPQSTKPHTFRMVRKVKIKPRLSFRKDWKAYRKVGFRFLHREMLKAMRNG